MSLARLLVLALVVVLPLTGSLVFAAGDVLVPDPWSKHHRHAGAQSHDVSRLMSKLPSGLTPTPPAVLALPLLGPLAATVSPAAASIALRPPFVPPRG